MSLFIILISFVVIVLALIGAAFYYHLQAASQQALTAQQTSRADHAEAGTAFRTQLDSTLAVVDATHRTETLHENKPEQLAARTDFDNDWSGSGLHAANRTASIDPNPAAVADTTRATHDTRE